MKDEKVYWGETFPMVVKVSDGTGASASLFIGMIGQEPTITVTSEFEDGVADVSVAPADMQIEPGEYQYQVKVVYTDGFVNKFPDPSKCEEGEETVLPKLEVLASLDTPVGS